MVLIRTLVFLVVLGSMGGCASLSQPVQVTRKSLDRLGLTSAIHSADRMPTTSVFDDHSVWWLGRTNEDLPWRPIDLQEARLERGGLGLPSSGLSAQAPPKSHLGIVIDEPVVPGALMDPLADESDSREIDNSPWHLGESVLQDHAQFYSPSSLGKLGLGVALSATLANTHGDEGLRDSFIDNVTHAGAGEYSEGLHQTKWIGDGYSTLPAFAGLALAGWFIDDVPIISMGGDWGERSLRTILVGGPPMLGLQYALGASRPQESGEQSEWQPFQDNNGVSGHAFMGAIPFLSAAKMTEDPYLKATFYVASALPGLSRIADDDHYPSQVLLGWWIAYLAASAVDGTHDSSTHVSVFPMLVPDGVGVGMEFRR